VVEDTTPPTLTGVRDLSFLLGEGAVLREGVSATDDCYGEVKLALDASMLDTSRKGIYSVYYTATDGQGNATEQRAYVTVYDTLVTEAMLDAACDVYLAPLLAEGADAETVCRRMHAALARDISYFPLSDKTDPTRAAYLALFVEGRGDCYSYFAAAQALLRRAGIASLAVERIAEAGELRHYWLMVNLAREGEAARWYHFDPTPLDAMGTDHNGCLFTDAELDAYNAVRPDFYRYDRTAYPATDVRSLR
jgi:transglutaminase-like putative cysteine protease